MSISCGARRGSGPLTLLALFSGHLTLDVHGIGAVVLLQAIWLVVVGAELRQAGPAPTEPRG